MWLFFVFYIRRNVSVNFQVKKKKMLLKRKKKSVIADSASQQMAQK